MPMLSRQNVGTGYENSTNKTKSQLDYIECAIGINTGLSKQCLQKIGFLPDL